jgi:hypothetical protein
MANMAYRTGKKQLLFSPEYEYFIKNNEANEVAQPFFRKGFEIPREV